MTAEEQAQYRRATHPLLVQYSDRVLLPALRATPGGGTLRQPGGYSKFIVDHQGRTVNVRTAAYAIERPDEPGEDYRDWLQGVRMSFGCLGYEVEENPNAHHTLISVIGR